MKKSLKTLVLGVSATALIASGAVTSPVNASSPLTVTVSKTSNLARVGESVNVSITGIPSGQGVYVFQCASDSLTPRPWARSGDPANKCGAISGGLWLSSPALSIPPSTFTTEASSPNPMRLERLLVVGSTTYDCAVTACSVFVMRDRQTPNEALSDTTLDAIVPISFAAPAEKPIAEKPVAEQAVVEAKLPKKITSSFRFSSGVSKVSKSQKRQIRKRTTDYRIASAVVITASAGRTPGVSERTVRGLAKKRANAIKKYLVSQGVPAEKIVIKTRISKSGKKPSTKIVATP